MPHPQVNVLVERAKRALSLHTAGDLIAAEVDYRAVIDKVEHIGLYSGFGALLLQTGRMGEAWHWLRRALVLAPAREEVVENVGVLLRERGDLDAAEVWLRRRLSVSTHTPHALANLGVVLTARQRYDEARAWLRSACRLQPENPDFRFNVAVVLERSDGHLTGLAAYRRALCLRPDHPGALENAALCAKLLGRGEEALALYRRLTTVRPDHAVGRFWFGNMKLLAGDWTTGWADYETRRAIPNLSSAANRNGHLPLWKGEPLPTGTLVLAGEQGVGDVLMFCRFLALAAARVGRILLHVHQPLVPLLRGQFAGVTVVPFDSPIQADVRLPLLSLPGALGVVPDSLPRDAYLMPPASRMPLWQGRLAERSGKRRFGLVWAGNPDYGHDRLRSPRLHPIRRLLDAGAWTPVLLQVGDGRKDLADVTLPPGVLDIGNGLNDFADTAAAIAGLDLVITSDTAVAHLGGAMGKPTWLMASCQADWRWMTAADGQPLWYPSMRIFRQRVSGGWQDVADDILRALAA